MAKPLGEVIDLKPGSNFGGGASGGTINIKSNFVISEQQGASYELRYNPYNGVMVLFQESKGENGVIFESRPDGKTDFTDLGYNLLNAGVITSPGSTDPITSQELYNSLINEAKVASKNAKIKNTEGKQINGISPPIAKADPKVIPQTAVVEETNEPENTDPAEPNNGGGGILDSAIQFGVNLFDKASGAIKSIPGIENLTLNEDLAKELQFGNKDKSTIVNYAQYPIDALYGRDYSGNMQDHVSIYQYSYKPPKKDLIFGKDGIGTLTDGVKRVSPLKDFIGLVKLPMPNDISDSNNISWGEDAMNNLSAAMTSAVVGNPVDVGLSAAALGATLGAFGVPGGAQLGAQIAMLSGVSGGDIRQIPSGLGGILNLPGGRALAGSAVASRLLALGGVQVSPESILARGYGIIPNSNMELLFNAPTLRQFQFNWKMTARSKEEAFKIRQIIRFFKQGMAAKKVNGTAGAASLFLGTPNVFKLKYKTIDDKDIEGVNRL